MASSGGLPPHDTAEETLETGLHHLSESSELCFLKNIYGGLLLSAGGLLALVLATGFPELSDNNPGLARLLQGIFFPTGLIVVYFLGGELYVPLPIPFQNIVADWHRYTGYPMWLTMTLLSRNGKPMQYIRAILTSLVGNFIGAFFWAAVQSYFTETLTEEPWRSRIIEQIDSDITNQHWHVIFLRSVGCGFLVTIAMLLGTQNRDGISKALGLHLPFFMSTAAKFPHTVEYMYLGTTGMMLGAKLTVSMFVWKCMLPVILGNSVGGALTGAYNYYVFIKREDDKQRHHGGEWLPANGGDE